MTHPIRIQLSRTKGFRLQAYSRALNGLDAIKVDRSTHWGNPFTMTGGCSSHADCVDLYANMIAGRATGTGPEIAKLTNIRHQIITEARPALAGRNLACWCKPGAPCHADVLLAFANPGDDQALDLRAFMADPMTILQRPTLRWIRIPDLPNQRKAVAA